MAYWLLKSEPETFSFSDLLRDKKTIWDGVRNYQARNNLRAMKKDDHALFYHSGAKREIVGIMKVTKEHFPDPTADSGDWSVVELKPIRALKNPVQLQKIKAEPKLKDLPLLRQSRLSVVPLTKKDFDLILKMSESS